MEKIYYLYKEKNSEKLFAFENEQELKQIRTVDKWSATKARMEAVHRILGVTLREDMNANEVKNFIQEYFYKDGSSWNKYRNVFHEIRNEKRQKVQELEYVNTLKVLVDGEGEYSDRALQKAIILSYTQRKSFPPIIKMFCKNK